MRCVCPHSRGFEPRSSCMLGKYSAIEIHLQSLCTFYRDLVHIHMLWNCSTELSHWTLDSHSWSQLFQTNEKMWSQATLWGIYPKHINISSPAEPWGHPGSVETPRSMPVEMYCFGSSRTALNQSGFGVFPFTLLRAAGEFTEIRALSYFTSGALSFFYLFIFY